MELPQVVFSYSDREMPGSKNAARPIEDVHERRLGFEQVSLRAVLVVCDAHCGGFEKHERMPMILPELPPSQREAFAEDSASFI